MMTKIPLKKKHKKNNLFQIVFFQETIKKTYFLQTVPRYFIHVPQVLFNFTSRS